MLASYSAFMFDFHSPHNLVDTCELVVDSIRIVTARKGTNSLILMDYLPTPPLMADIYLSTIRHDRVVVTAGNRVETFWQIIFEMNPSAQGGVYGTVSLDRPRRRVERWMGNVMEIQEVSSFLHRECSVKVLKQTLG